MRVHERTPRPLASAPLCLQTVTVMHFRTEIVEATCGVFTVQVHRCQCADADLLNGASRIELAGNLYLCGRAGPHLKLVGTGDAGAVENCVDGQRALLRLGANQPEVRE